MSSKTKQKSKSSKKSSKEEELATFSDLPADILVKIAAKAKNEDLTNVLAVNQEIKSQFAKQNNPGGYRESLFRQKLEKEFHFTPTYENMYQLLNTYVFLPDLVGKLASVPQTKCTDEVMHHLNALMLTMIKIKDAPKNLRYFYYARILEKIMKDMIACMPTRYAKYYKFRNLVAIVEKKIQEMNEVVEENNAAYFVAADLERWRKAYNQYHPKFVKFLEDTPDVE